MKLPEKMVEGEETIWSSGSQNNDTLKLDFKAIEDLFKVEEKPKRRSSRISVTQREVDPESINKGDLLKVRIHFSSLVH